MNGNGHPVGQRQGKTMDTKRTGLVSRHPVMLQRTAAVRGPTGRVLRLAAAAAAKPLVIILKFEPFFGFLPLIMFQYLGPITDYQRWL